MSLIFALSSAHLACVGFIAAAAGVRARVMSVLQRCERAQFCSYVAARTAHEAESDKPYPPFMWGSVRHPCLWCMYVGQLPCTRPMYHNASVIVHTLMLLLCTLTSP
jgi:hypothetical protein